LAYSRRPEVIVRRNKASRARRLRNLDRYRERERVKNKRKWKHMQDEAAARRFFTALALAGELGKAT